MCRKLVGVCCRKDLLAFVEPDFDPMNIPSTWKTHIQSAVSHIEISAP